MSLKCCSGGSDGDAAADGSDAPTTDAAGASTTTTTTAVDPRSAPEGEVATDEQLVSMDFYVEGMTGEIPS